MNWPSSQVSQIAPSSVTSPPAVLFSLRWVSAPSPANSPLTPSATSPRTIVLISLNKTHREPNGQRLRERYQRSISDRLLLKGRKNLDEGRSLPGVNYIPLPKIGEGLGEWSEAPSYAI